MYTVYKMNIMYIPILFSKIQIANSILLKLGLKQQSSKYQMPKYAWIKDQTGKEYLSGDISKEG